MDVLGEISLEGHPEKQERLDEIKEITDQGMDGGMTFRESLDKRIELLNAKESHLAPLVEALKKRVSKSFKRNKEFFNEYAKSVDLTYRYSWHSRVKSRCCNPAVDCQGHLLK